MSRKYYEIINNLYNTPLFMEVDKKLYKLLLEFIGDNTDEEFEKIYLKLNLDNFKFTNTYSYKEKYINLNNNLIIIKKKFNEFDNINDFINKLSSYIYDKNFYKELIILLQKFQFKINNSNCIDIDNLNDIMKENKLYFTYSQIIKCHIADINDNIITINKNKYAKILIDIYSNMDIKKILEYTKSGIYINDVSYLGNYTYYKNINLSIRYADSNYRMKEIIKMIKLNNYIIKSFEILLSNGNIIYII